MNTLVHPRLQAQPVEAPVSYLRRVYESGFAPARPREVIFLAHPMELASGLEFFSAAMTSRHLYAWSPAQLRAFTALGGALFVLKMLLAPLVWLLPFVPVDRYRVSDRQGNHVWVRTWLLPHFVVEYTWRWMRPLINWKIRRAVRRAARLGIEVVCLGAGNKSGLNNAGQEILDAVRAELPPGMKLMHGDNLTSAAVGARLRAVVRGGDSIMVLGAGKIVRPHLVALAQRGHTIKVLTSQKKLVDDLKRLVGAERAHLIQHVRSLRDGSDCRVWTNANFVKGRRGWDLVAALPQGVVLLDYCVPNVLTREQVRSRPDLCYIEAGDVLMSPALTSTRSRTLRLSPDGYYSCNAALITAMLSGGLADHEIGPELDPKEIEAWGLRMAQAGTFDLTPHAFGELVWLPR